MTRKAFYKSRRGLGALLVIFGVGLEGSGIVPPGTIQGTIGNIAALVGGLIATWGAIQAEQPLGVK